MARKDQQSKILFISTYTPMKCGIATFTNDLVNAVRSHIAESLEINICALDVDNSDNNYDYPVVMTMNGKDLNSCIETAQLINRDSSIKLVCIEHEFGLYGGDYGAYLLGFLSILEKPFVIRMHTVLPNPENKMLKIVQSIGLLAERIIVMTKHSEMLLKEDYNISEDKIINIPHGTHQRNIKDVAELKQINNLANRKVLTTFGLLSPNKGIEKGIIAMKQISAEFPDAMYIVVGQTHPNLIKQEGEKYRLYLQQLILELGLTKNVRLINEYVPIGKLMEYLALTDIYLFTSKDPNQAVSGTFLYAMSAGCTIISNSFVMAQEMLDEKTGIILNPDNENDLAENAIRIFQHPQLQREMSINAFMKTRDTTWQKVGSAQAGLIVGLLGINNIKSHEPASFISKKV
jgi:glycosyltransferase involved in cell wall biosynthesis